MSSSSSGQFHTSNAGQEIDAGSAVVRGSTLYYLVPGGSNNVKVDTCDVSGLQGGDVSSVTNNSKWGSFNLSDKVSKSNGASFKTNFRPAAVLLGTTVYFFWVDTSNSGQVYMASMDQTGVFSPCAYKIYGKVDSNTPAVQVGSYLSASVAPNGTSIVLCWCNTLTVVLGTVSLETLTLDPASIDGTNQQWIGTRGSTIMVWPNNTGLDKSYYRTSTAWFTQGNLGNFMIASFYSSDANHVYFLLFPLNDDGTPAYIDSAHVFTIGDLSVKRGFTMSRDPAGRIVGIYCQNDSNVYLYCRWFNTNQNVQKDASGKSPTLSWGSASLLNGISKDSQKTPVLSFVTGNATSSTVNLPTSTGRTQTFNCTNIPQYSFAFYAENNKNSNGAYDIQCQTALYGTSSIVPGYNTITPATQYASNRIVSMIMDSFPFPNQNLGTSVSPNQKIIEYTYGASSATVLSATASFELLFGVRSSFSTTKGIGPALDAEFKTGPQGSFGVSTGTTLVDGYSVFTTPIVAPAGSPTQYKVESHGEYYGSTLSNIVEDIAVFQDTSGTVVNGADAPLFSQLRPVPAGTTSRVSGQYGTYCYTPGDIYSYQQSNIDETMAALYNGLSAQDKAYFTPDYANGYIEKVVLPNAQTITGNQNYLQFTIDGSGHSSQTLEVIKNIIATLGWTIQGSLYVGVSGGEELSIFGFGAGFELSLLAGFEYNFTVTGGVQQTSTWGIAYENDSPAAVSGGLSYNVKMYILQPSNMWARELQLFSPEVASRAAIDFDDCAPSKIMFVVSNIQNTLQPTK